MKILITVRGGVAYVQQTEHRLHEPVEIALIDYDDYNDDQEYIDDKGIENKIDAWIAGADLYNADLKKF